MVDEIARAIIDSNNVTQESNKDVLTQLRGDKSGRRLTNSLIVLFCILVTIVGAQLVHSDDSQQKSIDAIAGVSAQNAKLIGFVSALQTPTARDAATRNTQAGREYIVLCTDWLIARRTNPDVPPPNLPALVNSDGTLGAALPACPLP